MPTAFHAAYWAEALSISETTGTVADLSRSIANARVDLNPHQVDAALFAIRSPLSKGVILADEVGLGKTIEAGLVIAQRWAERRRRILLVVPATLRKQWQEELRQKFALPSSIIDGKAYNAEATAGRRPFDRPGAIVITSYQFAAAKADDLAALQWDLIVFDEAHRLRNVYKSHSRIAAALRDATLNAPKLLLTATPLQNSLIELYGLASFVDPHLFGDERSFREQFGTGSLLDPVAAQKLRARLRSVFTRTLRTQVAEYVKFTNRVAITQDFLPSEAEQFLYDEVSEYLRRPVLAALPSGQRALLTIVLRRLLASSTFAIAGTLRAMIARVEEAMAGREPAPEDYLVLPDLEDMDDLAEEFVPHPDQFEVVSHEQLVTELADLRSYLQLAESITVNAKGAALLVAFKTALDKASALGAARKAVVFTESRRTQEYLVRLLEQNGYTGQVTQINGANADPASRARYDRWLEQHRGTSAVTGSRPVDVRSAIIDGFREDATVLVATEAAAEGVNLQFCSLVVNYDLPWNPQRIEQRIGRCHRYGQQHDVVVVNLLNTANAADERVFELLSLKFRLFEGVFGASDEVLGAIEGGIDFERRIASVYQHCRTADEITAAFDSLQADLDAEIAARMDATRQAVLDHFDEDVQGRLRVHREQAQESLAERQRWLWELTRFELGSSADFDATAPRFAYTGGVGPAGRYHLLWQEAEKRGDEFYRPEHPLAKAVIEQAIGRELSVAVLKLELSGAQPAVTSLAPFAGQRGWMMCGRLHASSLREEKHLVLAGLTDEGARLDRDQCRRVLGLRLVGEQPYHGPISDTLDTVRTEALAAVLDEVDRRNAVWYDEEVAKLEAWAADLRVSLERELKDLDRQIDEARRAAQAVATLAEKLEGQRRQKELERQRAEKRRALYDAQDQIAARRDEMISAIERQLAATHTWSERWVVRWELA